MENNAPGSEEEKLFALLQAARLTAGEKLDQLSEAEQAALQQWLQYSDEHREWKNKLEEGANLSELEQEYQRFSMLAAADLEKTRRKMQLVEPARLLPLYKRWWAVAAILLLLASGMYIVLKPVEVPKQVAVTKEIIPPIQPGKEGAVLTLADGSQLVLDSMGNGNIAKQSGASISLNNGRLAYEAAGEQVAEIAYNTMRTPKGRQFNLVLPDGTKVWLNAASSLRFPTTFTGKERQVELLGEAYFEVADNKAMPFVVNTNGTVVQVLGTHFNIMAYPDENEIATTLLEGSVQVVKNSRKQILKPGQVAVVKQAEEGISISSADVDHAIAWKNGNFVFQHENIKSLMRKVARWYDVEIVYEGGVADQEFGGTFSRSKTLSQLLANLELTKTIHFRMEGRTVVVMP